VNVLEGLGAPPVLEADREQDVRRCWPAFRELRPQIADEDEFVARWKRQREEGYAIVYVEQGADVVAAAGFRIMNTMAWGKILYLDDLVALSSQRGRGLGAKLLVWLQQRARDQGCDSVHLDTGYQRHAAHKSYLRNGFTLNCHHMACDIRRS
jgi:GNAT superfamily N-acetyltransferase